jgi:DNA-binding transcriptional ArsR family regulator
MIDIDNVVQVGAVLSSGTRLAIFLCILENYDVTVGQLATAFDVAPSTITHHVSRLLQVGLVERRRSGGYTKLRARADRWRPLRDGCMTCTPTSTPAPWGSTVPTT